jgi:hypothetical protein
VGHTERSHEDVYDLYVGSFWSNPDVVTKRCTSRAVRSVGEHCSIAANHDEAASAGNGQIIIS